MAKKLTVCYFGVNDKGGKNSMTLRRLQENNVEVLDVWSENKITLMADEASMSKSALFKRVLVKLKVIPQIVRHWNRIVKSEVIFVGYPGHFDLPLAWIVSGITGKPLVFDQSTFLVDTLADDVGILQKRSFLASLILWAEKLMYQLPDVILVDTEVIKNYLHQSFGVTKNKLEVLLLGADEKVYRFSGFKKPEKKMTVLYYGLYNPIHGVEHIVEAAKLCSKNPKVEFVMVGSGRLQPETEAKARKYKLKNMTFYPSMPEAEVQAILKKADVFLGFMQDTPSLHRFIPNKVAQGVALGKAVITSKSEAIESVFTDQKNVYLCEPSDPKSLARAIEDLAAHPKLLSKIAEGGYQLFQDTLSMKAVGKHLIQILKQTSRK